MAIDGRNGVVQLANHFALAPDAGVDDVHDPYRQPTYDEGNGNADDSTDYDFTAAAPEQSSLTLEMPQGQQSWKPSGFIRTSQRSCT